MKNLRNPRRSYARQYLQTQDGRNVFYKSASGKRVHFGTFRDGDDIAGRASAATETRPSASPGKPNTPQRKRSSRAARVTPAALAVVLIYVCIKFIQHFLY